MLKFIGIILIIGAGTAIGFVQAARYAARPRQIRYLLLALQRLETEISYGQTPLPDALERISGLVPSPLSRIFLQVARSLKGNPLEKAESHGIGETVIVCWEDAFNEHWPTTAMKKEEKAAIIHLGSALGRSDRHDQLKHIRLTMVQLQTEETSAREEQHRYEKLSRSLGMLGAALIVILLV